MHERVAVGPAMPSGTAAEGGTRSRALARLPGSGWLYAYVAVEVACQLALLFGALAPARVVFRSAAFGASLALLLLVPGRAHVQHTARMIAFLVIGVLTLSALNPGGSTLLAVIAHWCFYAAVLAPIFWVARLDIREGTLVRLLLIFWLYSSLSSIFGVLQASFPGQFQPSISTLIRPDKVLAIKLASGEWVARPMGLTDIPGGAASSGLYASLLGLGFTLGRPFRFARAFGVISMIAGMVCIYLCQIRAMVVMLAICTTVLIGMFAVSGRLSRLAFALTLGVGMAVVGFYFAFALGGEMVTSRLATLVEGDPGTVYGRNRGHFLEHAFFELLPEYPLGAGLGRWGMMNQYFGAPEDSIWTEVQWGGWILDGGIFMVVVYPAAVIAMLAAVVRITINSRGSDFGLWAAVVVAYGVGTLALTFSYPVFLSTGGIEFWLITAVAIQAARHRAGAVGARPS
jgi:hypothetical protein